MKSRSCKSKGRRLVAELRAAVLASFPELEEDDILMVPTSVGGCDLKLSPAARKRWPFSTECKNVERIALWAAIRQAEANAGGHPPALVFRRNHYRPWAALPLEVLLSLLRRISDAEDR